MARGAPTRREALQRTQRRIRLLLLAGIVLIGASLAFDLWLWRLVPGLWLLLPVYAWQARGQRLELEAHGGESRPVDADPGRDVRQRHGAAAFCMLSAIAYGVFAALHGGIWTVLALVFLGMALFFESSALRLERSVGSRTAG